LKKGTGKASGTQTVPPCRDGETTRGGLLKALSRNALFNESIGGRADPSHLKWVEAWYWKADYSNAFGQKGDVSSGNG
jgi:hypothetical protein